ncbi:RHS repeat-associated core domain-containing protein [Arachidicoccus sp.]|uniref:RHS repeat-associated core domain-containing protein n=1 Tax=Arachidicoccus sp. TaxID=1872624 RepID=UPI003D1FBE2A
MEVRGYSDYYPYGMVLRSGGTNYRYGYQGAYAEKDGETDWNAFELRMYDSRIARWMTTDPAGQYYSPYVAMGNDPVNGVDKDGGTDDCPTCPVGSQTLTTVIVYAQVQRPVNISHLDGININVNLWQQSLVKIKAPPTISPTPEYDAYIQSWVDFNRMGSEVREKGILLTPNHLISSQTGL